MPPSEEPKPKPKPRRSSKARPPDTKARPWKTIAAAVGSVPVILGVAIQIPKVKEIVWPLLFDADVTMEVPLCHPDEIVLTLKNKGGKKAIVSNVRFTKAVYGNEPSPLPLDGVMDEPIPKGGVAVPPGPEATPYNFIAAEPGLFFSRAEAGIQDPETGEPVSKTCLIEASATIIGGGYEEQLIHSGKPCPCNWQN